MHAVGGLALLRAQRLARVADVAGAMTLEALKGTPVAFDERIHNARPHPGQKRSRAICSRCCATAKFARRTARRSARAGRLQPALHAAGARRRPRRARALRRSSCDRIRLRDRQSARLYRQRRRAFRREFSRRAARARARLRGHRDDRFDEHQRTAHRSPRESGFERRACRLFSPSSRACNPAS